MSTPEPTVGARVSVDHPKYPGTWVVKKVGPVNVVLEPENGGRPLRCPPALLRPPGQTPRVYDTVLYSVGEVVSIDSGKFTGMYVVIADRGAHKVNIAKLGGDGGAYVRALRGSLRKVGQPELAAWAAGK